jgi:TRAP-type C4-dicarboxylate transport system permease small subunit
VLVVFGALAYAQERRAHIRVELLYSHVGPAGKSFMEAVTHIVAFVFFALVAWQGYVELLYSWEIKESTMGSVRFPLYPARVLLLVGVALLLLRLAIDIAQDIGRLRRGEAPPEVALPERTE